MKKKYWIIVVVGVILVINFGLYFSVFHNGLSHDQNDWIAFGNYFAGISGILNVIVFVWLTIWINSSDEKSRERDLQHQETIIKAQLRFEELHWLINQFNKVTEIEISVIHYGKVSEIAFTINSFLQSRTNLFPILAEDSTRKLFVEMCDVLNGISKLLMESAGLDKNGLPTKRPDLIISDSYKEYLKKFHSLRIDIINLIENYILKELRH